VDPWAVFADWVLAFYASANPAGRCSGRGWFAAVSGVEHADLNVCGLSPRAGPSAATALAGALAELPSIVFTSQWLDDATRLPLIDAGFRPSLLPEPLMRCSRRPDQVGGPFVVRRANSPAEIEAAIALVSEAHRVPRQLLTPIFRSAAVDERAAAWLAWECHEAVSTVWTVALAGVLTVVEMMTPEHHQRRGAGRQLLAASLMAAWPGPEGQALLLSSSAGRRLYESLGFVAVDEITTLTRGADERVLDAIGQD
jgi:GNAT superfamily N-acetyltransferase